MNVPIADLAQQRTVRLIPAGYYSAPVMRALVDSDDEFALLERVESLASKRRITPPPRDNMDEWGSAMIHAAFTYTRRGGNRFNGERDGAWYAGFDERTALNEVAYHHSRELSYANVFHDRIRYRALHASFIGRFHDLRNMEPEPDCLHPEPERGYGHGQSLAAELRARYSRGLIYPSVRYQGGTCIVAFQPNVVQDVMPGPEWEVSWSGSPHWAAMPI